MKKKIISSIIAATTFFYILPSNVSAVNSSYLALGDSISTGYGLACPEEEGFVSLIAAEKGYTLENHAVNGYTAEDIYTLIKDGSLDEEITNAELITVTCGGNDLMHLLYQKIADAYNQENDPDISSDDVVDILNGKDENFSPFGLISYVLPSLINFANTDEFNAGLELYVASITSVMNYLHSQNPHALIILNTQYNPYDSFKYSPLYNTMYEEIEKGITKLNAVIQNNAIDLDYLTADVYSAFNKYPNTNLCNSDITDPLSPKLDFHPNSFGHLLIAQTVLLKLEELIPSAVFTATGETEGRLTDYTDDMQYSIDGGTTWKAAGSVITGASAEYGILIRNALGDIQNIALVQQSSPTGLGTASCSNSSQNDGKITGTASYMEYSSDNGKTWSACSNGEISGLTDGKYLVRTKANGTSLASPAVTVEIAAHICKADTELWVADEETHHQLCSCGTLINISRHIFGDWTVIDEATTAEAGKRSRICEACGTIEAEIIPQLPSSDISEIIENNPPETPEASDIISFPISEIDDSQVSDAMSSESGNPSTGINSYIFCFSILLISLFAVSAIFSHKNTAKR